MSNSNSDNGRFVSGNAPLDEDQIYSVSELTQSIKFLLEEGFPTVWLTGEISNYRLPSSGHAYFALKDAESQIRCVFFKWLMGHVRFDIEDGLEVLVRGRLTIYEARGEYQITVDYMEPRGVGALQLAFEQLKERLLKEGMFDADKKKAIPQFPEKIGIVTSPTGAAIKDILSVIKRRYPNVNILIYPVRVQGDGAAGEIAAGIEALNEMGDIDVIIVGRGGGSIEDLWAFNEEVVARAIYASSIPVVSAVGHEIDFTIADFAADLRAPTPSAAAELVVPDREELRKGIADIASRMATVVLNDILNLRDRLEYLTNRCSIASPTARLEEMRQRLDDMEDIIVKDVVSLCTQQRTRLEELRERIWKQRGEKKIVLLRDNLNDLQKRLLASIINRGRFAQNRLASIVGKLNALSPLASLERGYSICYSYEDRRVVKDVAGLAVGDRLDVRLWGGELLCDIIKIIDDNRGDT